MDKRTYARIGRKKLIEAIGPLTLTVYHISGPSEDVCADCPHFYGSTPCPYAHNNPRSCIHYDTVSQPRTQYIYEQKHTNKGNRLSLAALKVLCLLHMQTVSGDGVIKDFDPFEAAREIGCCPQTVKNCLEMLCDRNYIMYSNGTDSYLYTILIKNYNDMFLEAKKGGSGYLFINDAFLQALLNCKTITAARLLIRTYDFIYGKSQIMQSVKMSFEELYSAFPAYICKGHIKRALTSLQDVIQTIWNKHSVSFRFMDGFDARAAHRQAYEDSKDKISSSIEEMTGSITGYNKALTDYDRAKTRNDRIEKAANNLSERKKDLLKVGITKVPAGHSLPANPLPELSFSEEEITNFVQIATEYSSELVTEAILQAYLNSPDFAFKADSGQPSLLSRGAIIRLYVQELADLAHFKLWRPSLFERQAFGF